MAEKEGVDYKLVPMKDSKGGIVKDGKGNPVKTRKFFTRAEKAAMKAPKVDAKAATKAKPAVKAKAVAKATEKPVSKNAMAGYRAGDVTTSTLEGAKSTPAKKSNTDKMRGAARTSAKGQISVNDTRKKLRDLEAQLDKNSAALAAASLGSGVLTRGNTDAKGKPSNPTYGSQKPQATGPQGKMNTSVARPARVGGAKGISGNNPASTAKRLGGGGRGKTFRDPKDFNPFLN